MQKLTTLIFLSMVGVLFFQVLVGFPVRLENPLDDIVRTESLFTGDNSAQQKMKGVHLVESNSGERDWELFAEVAEGYEGKGSWLLKNVRVLFYNDEVVDFTVTGKSGMIDSKTKDMTIEGEVKTQSSNGYRFETPSMQYRAKSRILLSPDKVKMTGPPDVRGGALQLEGERMEAQVDQSLMTIEAGVLAKKSLIGGRQFKIHSEKAEFSGKSKAARFLNQVAIEIDSMKLEGPEASFNYKDSTDFLQSIMVRGGVKVSDIDKYATAENVKFDPSENKFIFSGQPRVVQNSDEIVGDQIVFIDGGKRVKVENIRAKVEKKQ
ncbi:MAG: LPS export ABC transporter periplasmic protein LptC [Pseudobdellovibrionaceae bacterium]|jgi:LPS export ABC transporter protein LptC